MRGSAGFCGFSWQRPVGKNVSSFSWFLIQLHRPTLSLKLTVGSLWTSGPFEDLMSVGQLFTIFPVQLNNVSWCFQWVRDHTIRKPWGIWWSCNLIVDMIARWSGSTSAVSYIRVTVNKYVNNGWFFGVTHKAHEVATFPAVRTFVWSPLTVQHSKLLFDQNTQ